MVLYWKFVQIPISVFLLQWEPNGEKWSRGRQEKQYIALLVEFIKWGLAPARNNIHKLWAKGASLKG